jgi:2-dehydro-3-deoxyphosphogluconate aldolase/(4S)-4-hydroxy-2-oxoglutarate aldolase
MPKSKAESLKWIEQTGVVAVIRARSKDQLLDLAKALIEGGVIAVEVTMSTPKAVAGIEQLADHYGDQAVIGAGTVIDAGTCADVINAGAQFVLSPTFDPRVVETTKRYGKISVPGAFTPTEILTAWSAGADVVKVFPSTALGPAYFKDILAPMPQLKLTPTGGVDVKNCGDWIRAGAVCVGAGSALVSKKALETNDWKSVTANAKAFVDAIKAARAT